MDTPSDDSPDDDDILMASTLILYDDQQNAVPNFGELMPGHEVIDRNRSASHVFLLNILPNSFHKSKILVEWLAHQLNMVLVPRGLEFCTCSRIIKKSFSRPTSKLRLGLK